ncbi:MAG: MFS transporter [Coxiellaceae bacterium]|jgi:MFS family permease|nr:MFS transporter [Coxiellaceae bacterium]
MNQKVFVEKISIQAIVILLLASCFYLYEFIMQVAPGAIAENLMHDFNIDATKLGFLSGCFYCAYTPLQLTSGLLLDRYSTRIILTCVTTICSFGVLLFAYAPNVYIAALARFIIGGASACSFIGVLHLAIRWIPSFYFALFAGLVEMMGSVGGALGSKPFSILLKYFDWRTTTLGFSYLGFFLAFLIALFVRDQPHNLIKITPQKTDQNFIWNNLKTVLHNRETWAIGTYSLLIWAPVIGFAALWGASFLRLSCNLDNITATLAITYMWLGIALASPFIGWLSDLIERRCIIMSICALVGTVAITIVIFGANLSPSLLNFLTFALGFASAAQTLSFALIKDNNSPNTVGTANGFNNMCVVASGILLPILIGKILDFNWQGTMQNNVRIYSLSSYQLALATLPLCYFIAFLTSVFGIKETYCLPKHNMEKVNVRY